MKDSERPGPDRRRATRIPEKCKVAFRAIREGARDSKTTAAQTLNLSASGLCLVAPSRLERDQHLALELSLEGHKEPVVAVGRVVWCDEDEGTYRVGICFTWLRDEDRRALEVISEYVRDR
ncbi:MAG: PilZ domain-containing protein, partial [Planctomycetes bacterium]|nr:PilZ domain-containing protein [Planctomycetota bacterium]